MVSPTKLKLTSVMKGALLKRTRTRFVFTSEGLMVAHKLHDNNDLPDFSLC